MRLLSPLRRPEWTCCRAAQEHHWPLAGRHAGGDQFGDEIVVALPVRPAPLDRDDLLPRLDRSGRRPSAIRLRFGSPQEPRPGFR